MAKIPYIVGERLWEKRRRQQRADKAEAVAAEAQRAYLESIRGEPGAGGDPGVGGEQGPKGDKGDKGDPGTNGTNGTDGKDGLDGADGTNGTNGALGKTGLTGLTGAKGDTGKTGPRGLKGDKGDDGILPPKGPPFTQPLYDEAGDFKLAPLPNLGNSGAIGTRKINALIAAAIAALPGSDPPTLAEVLANGNDTGGLHIVSNTTDENADVSRSATAEGPGNALAVTTANSDGGSATATHQATVGAGAGMARSGVGAYHSGIGAKVEVEADEDGARLIVDDGVDVGVDGDILASDGAGYAVWKDTLDIHCYGSEDGGATWLPMLVTEDGTVQVTT